jgi:hypothetical protein
MKGKGPQGEGDGSAPPIERRRWEAVLPREEIATLLAENKFEELLARLAEVRGKWPRDLELLRSVRVLEDHLRTHPARKA